MSNRLIRNPACNPAYNVLATLFLVFTTMTAAHAQALDGASIRAQLYGQTMIGEYPNGNEWRETFHDNETTFYSENGTEVLGSMKVQDGLICFSYHPSYGLVGGCFEVWKRSANCFDFYGTGSIDETATRATIVQKRQGQAWSARAWYADKPSTCVAELVS